ncbi:hypothetical protein PUN28_007388 [Cardiocondyla obscurior]|uniref:Uncharacterized protein n=1 Tax=Cardiocondyla obscurior TaxID=286306 RepID=A0AAW2G599_9HYME
MSRRKDFRGKNQPFVRALMKRAFGVACRRACLRVVLIACSLCISRPSSQSSFRRLSRAPSNPFHRLLAPHIIISICIVNRVITINGLNDGYVDIKKVHGEQCPSSSRRSMARIRIKGKQKVKTIGRVSREKITVPNICIINYSLIKPSSLRGLAC